MLFAFPSNKLYSHYKLVSSVSTRLSRVLTYLLKNLQLHKWNNQMHVFHAKCFTLMCCWRKLCRYHFFPSCMCTSGDISLRWSKKSNKNIWGVVSCSSMRCETRFLIGSLIYFISFCICRIMSIRDDQIHAHKKLISCSSNNYINEVCRASQLSNNNQ